MASRVRILAEGGSFRLIDCYACGYAVVEVRDGYVYSTDAHHVRRAPDGASGMQDVAAATGWMTEPEARRKFDTLVKAGQRLARKMR